MPGLPYVLAEAERLIAGLAALQQGQVSRRQLLRRGLSPDAVDRRISSGRLLVIRPGVYAVGYLTETSRARCATALLDAGPGSLISHLSSAAEWRFRLPAPLVVDITNPRRLRSRDGIRIHTRAIDPAEVRYRDGLPITSPAQTLFDLATMLGARPLAEAANEAFVLQLLDLDDLRRVLERNPRRKGSTAFRRLLATLDPEDRRIRSPLEARLSAFLRARRFPPWEQNVRLEIGGETIEPDVLWRHERVVVEADGRDPHLAPLTFASDRRRDRRLRVEGWEPVRVTSEDLDSRPDELDADLRSLLGISPGRASPTEIE